METAFIDRIKAIIEANIGNPDFGVEQLAREMHMSYSSLRRRVSSSTGKSAKKMIREIRLTKAFGLLKEGEMTIAEIAFSCGFSSPNYFSNSFQEYFGYPPRELKGERGEHIAEAIKAKEKDDAGKNHFLLVLKKGIQKTEWILAPLVILVVAAVSVVFVLSGLEREYKTIAVLYPTNINRDPKMESFCGGFRNQLLSDLKRSTDLSPISRISTDFYRNMELGMPEIGRKLNADLLIASSVSLDNGTLFLNLNLIDSKNDFSLWSHKYRRRMVEPLTLESELSKQIVREIKAAMLLDRPGPDSQTSLRNPEAVKLLQEGNFYSDEMNFRPDLALLNYREAIRRDTLLAGAYLGLANVLNKVYTEIEIRRDTYLTESLLAIQKAAGINGGMQGIHEQYGLYHLRVGDFHKSVEESSRELDLHSGSPEALYNLAEAWMSLGRWNKAENSLLQALEESPYLVIPNYRLGYFYELKRDYRRAGNHYRLAVSINPAFLPSVLGMVLVDLKSEGNPAGTLTLLDSLATFQNNSENPLGLVNLRAFLNLVAGRFEEALRVLDCQVRTTPPSHPWYFRPVSMLNAMTYGFLMEPGKEREWYDSTRIYLEALQQTSVINRNDPRVNAALGIAFIGLGMREKALAFADNTGKLLAEKPDALYGPYALEDAAFVYTKAGLHDKAIEIIRKLLSSPGPLTKNLLELDPRWESLRKTTAYNDFKQD